MTGPAADGKTGVRGGLSARLLILTIFFVMLAEFLIWAPSVARYRLSYLEARIASGHLAALALEATPDNMVSVELRDRLLFHAGVFGVMLQMKDKRIATLSDEMPPRIDESFDLRGHSFIGLILDTFAVMLRDEHRAIRVRGISPKDLDVVVGVILDEAALRESLYAFSARILQLSIVISLFTAGLVYLSLQWLMVRPLRRLTHAMTHFRDGPEDESRIIQPEGRSDEIGLAQDELADMQRQIRASLKQKDRLATLGAAVAKVNHDLRNSLATAMLVSDRLADSADPEVQRIAPRLYDSMNRAVDLCSQTLNYVSDAGPQARPERLNLAALIGEVAQHVNESVALGKDLAWRIQVPGDLEFTASRVQMFRVLENLANNSVQAGARELRFSARAGPERLEIMLADDGPGLAQRAIDKMFQPFAGSAREGGAGLGLVIVHDIMRACHGDVELVESSDRGATFRLTLPAP